MIIVTRHLVVDPDDRDAYLWTCRGVVVQGRAAPGCLEFVLVADPIDPARIVVLERWETAEQLMAFRGAGTPDDLGARILSAEVAEYEVTSPVVTRR